MQKSTKKAIKFENVVTSSKKTTTTPTTSKAVTATKSGNSKSVTPTKTTTTKTTKTNNVTTKNPFVHAFKSSGVGSIGNDLEKGKTAMNGIIDAYADLEK